MKAKLALATLALALGTGLAAPVAPGPVAAGTAQAMVAGGMSKAKRRDKKTLDRISAAVILQRWLSARP